MKTLIDCRWSLHAELDIYCLDQHFESEHIKERSDHQNILDEIANDIASRYK